MCFSYTVLRLYDKEILSLDTPLLHYIGNYNRFNAADPRYAKITARMVLRHTSGLPNWGDSILPLLFEHENMGEKKLAIENYKKAVALNPNDNYSAGQIKKLESEANQ
ncbi:MAG TPA: serine hydrolase [Puia sp.]|nr:serine hydrolase [Puia sp.]